ncbi:MAG: GNAT family N-acetyltransferase [Ruminococcaceae bacterium]|nr:GNAT family N-acetyltransferase [Oscillospiraceae bacterium]
MIIEPFEFKLKDGRTAIARSPKDEDIQEMLDFLYVTAGETEFILRYPEECHMYTAENEKDFFDRINGSPTDAMLICFVDGKIAGNCAINCEPYMKTKHRASLAIGLLREFWNQGIGTKLFQRLIEIAEQNKDLIQLELDFIEGNERGQALYEKMGFKIVGVKPNAVRLKNGTLLNEYSMIREIKR